jgi:hypothetical protein
VQHAVRYLVWMETGMHTPDETLRRAKAPPRQRLLAQALRHLTAGASSRYLVQLKPDVVPPRAAGPARTAPIARLGGSLPWAGWISLDPTRACSPVGAHPLIATCRTIVRRAAVRHGRAGRSKLYFG